MPEKVIKIDESDNVATTLDDLETGTRVTIKGDTNIEVVTNSRIPKGHKLALYDIKKGEHVIKYGQIIGVATCDIRKGDHVHTHNLDSIRGKSGEGNE